MQDKKTSRNGRFIFAVVIALLLALVLGLALLMQPIPELPLDQAGTALAQLCG